MAMIAEIAKDWPFWIEAALCVVIAFHMASIAFPGDA